MGAAVGELQRDYLYYTVFDFPTLIGSAMPVEPVAAELKALYDKIRKDANGLQLDMYNMKAIIPPRKTADIAISYAGQKKHYSGVDESQTSTTLEFLQDERGLVYKFFNYLQQLTGDEKTHSAVYEPMQNFTMSVAEVSVTKKTITLYKTLVNTKVLGVNVSQPNKEGNNVGRVNVDIVWDISKTVESMHGKEF